MAPSRWQRRIRKFIPMALLAGVLAVPAAGLVSGVREARRAAESSATT